jgi:hypothetical protein
MFAGGWRRNAQDKELTVNACNEGRRGSPRFKRDHDGTPVEAQRE